MHILISYNILHRLCFKKIAVKFDFILILYLYTSFISSNTYYISNLFSYRSMYQPKRDINSRVKYFNCVFYKGYIEKLTEKKLIKDPSNGIERYCI